MSRLETNKYMIRGEDIAISKRDIGAVMGYDDGILPEHLDDIIDEALRFARETCRIEGGYVIEDQVEFNKEKYSLTVESETFNVDRIVFQQLKKADRLAFFVCTAGSEIADVSRAMMKEGDLLGGYTYDVVGSLAVEAGMDIVQDSLRKDVRRFGLMITNRYSPGYCGWNVAEQKKLFALLPDRFCGITLTDSCLMKPIKSVSGVIGIGRSVKFSRYTCSICEDESCMYRNLKRKKEVTDG